ncbi:MAG: CBASS cGAMP synthase [Pseudomonas kermanshahensis]|uniref:CBASS cGAMP synthase n=1 Tax=Pseudomonas kermanshahensis TaxID=2745482 RepID=UPI003D124652
MPNLSPLLYSSNEHTTFLKGLDLVETEKQEINAARADVRAELREKLPGALRDRGYEGKECKPKFFIQGSWAYKTLNRPCQTPPQQSDVDDGVYLPMSIVTEENRPMMAIKDFRAAVSDVLQPLCDGKGWELTSKATCLRVEISTFAHIDLPLYAIPDDQYALIVESMEARNYGMLKSIATNSEQDCWKKLPSDKILLACEDKWIVSDPLKMKEWFELEISDKEEQLRRVIRYIKAFRDNQWDKGGPSSILLMAAACPLFTFHYKRDDLALLAVVSGLPDALREGVKSPVDSKVYLTEALGEEGVEEAAEKFETFKKYLVASIEDSAQKEMACRWMRTMLGDRFPDRPDLISESVSQSMPAAMAAIPPEKGPSEIVKRTKAG